MQPAPQKNEPSVTLHQMAEQVWNAYEGSHDLALGELRKQIRTNPSLMEEAITQGLRVVLQETIRRIRVDLTKTGTYRPKVYTAEYQNKVEKATRGMYNWPLMDGSPLGKATKEKLLKEAHRYGTLAKGNERRSRFMALIAAELEEGQVVEEKLTEADLDELMNRSE